MSAVITEAMIDAAREVLNERLAASATVVATRIAGRTHAEWVEFAKRDDAMDNMIPSDLRKILAAFGPVEKSAVGLQLYASEKSNQYVAAMKENAELRAALEPFANRAKRFDEIPGVYLCHDNVELWQDGNWRCDLTVGDLRRARSALRTEATP